ncbi:MAG: type II toxin-antitoxin system HicA family toxin [Desulfovibrio sp.]|nr:type II toxin-antitoxin system HicA family toxin [Desulfovibrio sp.]
MDSRKVIQELLRDGWYHVSTVGDHWHFKHPTKPDRTTVPHPQKDIDIFVLKSIERQSGLNLRRKG